MRKYRQRSRVSARRVVVKQYALIGDDDPLFDERDLEYSGAGDEKVKPP